jgi:hypothetical protein
MSAMRVLPTSGLRLMLLPFKAYTALAYFAVAIGSGYLPRHADYTGAAVAILYGYLVSFAVLCIGGLVQKSDGDRSAYLLTCGFAVADLVFVALLLPYLSHT